MRSLLTACVMAAVAWSTLVGCAATRTYQVRVANRTDLPITFGLVKEGGGPYEPQWASPEDAAIMRTAPTATMWAGIAPGQTAGTSPVQGRFDRDARAVLRVYRGRLKLPEILAISRGQPNRLDIPLHPGLNRLTITDVDGRFTAIRDEPGGGPVDQD